jgi:RNA polymerase sigma-70 factor (ECF subfamily)
MFVKGAMSQKRLTAEVAEKCRGGRRGSQITSLIAPGEKYFLPGCNNPGSLASLPMKANYGRRTLLSVLEEQAIAIPGELEQAFRAHHSVVFRTAYRITGNAGDAEDALQTVFLRLLRRGRNAEALENTESYLRRAAINAALDVVRSRIAERSIPLPDEASGLMPAAPGQADVSDLRQALTRAMAQLKPRQAEIFALRFLEGLSNGEISQALGISQVLVAVTVHRTRQQLRKELRPYLSIRS